jgi:AraC-like DNA-binding protein
MYANSAYLKDSQADREDYSRPLIVTSCGTYRLYTKKEFSTVRPEGRRDYQLIYVSKGKAYFWNEGERHVATAGQMVLYRPHKPQRYIYYGEDKTEVFWVHFTGNDVENILKSYGVTKEIFLMDGGGELEYRNLLHHMIKELQMCYTDYEEMLSTMLKQIFILLHRHLPKDSRIKNSQAEDEIDKAVTYFYEHYNEQIEVADYAKSHHMSVSWFIRSFKKVMGTTPAQYIMSIRLSNAQSLLESTAYNVTEISKIVGYDNPLYFSRIFKKEKGISPLQYRKKKLQ